MMDKKQKKRKDAFATPGSSNRSTPASAASMASNALAKSADNRSRASSSKSVTSSTKSINKSDDLGSSLSKPELITGYDLRAHLQQIMKFSDDEFDDDDDTLYSSEEEYSIESFDDKDDRDEELRQLAAQSNDDAEARTPLPTGMNNFQALVPITEEEGDDLDSEEENEIMKEIRNEIVNNVRQEMKSELELYKYKMKKLENSAEGTPNEPGSDQSAGNLQPDLDNLDPKLRAAIIKMKKLDKMLSKRIRREKEVKRDRILLERRIKKEIEELHREKKDEYKEVLNNEQKFLALELPARHNEDVSPLAICHSQTKTDSVVCSVKDLYLRRSCVVQYDVCSRSNSVAKTDLSRSKPFVLDDENLCSTSKDYINPRSKSTSKDDIKLRSNTNPQYDTNSRSNSMFLDDISPSHKSASCVNMGTVQDNSAHSYSINSNLSVQSDLDHWSKPAILGDNLSVPESVIQSKLPQNVIPDHQGDVSTETEQTKNDDTDFRLESALGIDLDLYSISPGSKLPSLWSESVIYKNHVLSTTSDILPTSHSPNSSVIRSPALSEIHLNLLEIVTDISDKIKGVTVPDEFTGEEVFATQLNEEDYPGLKPESKTKKGHRTGRTSQRSDKDSVRTGSDDEHSRGDASSVTSGSVDGNKHKKKRKKDFIKRNKELAGDAANLIAMTDEEKKRLEDLLRDVEDIPDIPIGADLDENNPFQLAVKPGEGFQPESDEMRSLTSIDSRLKELMPPDDYQSIASSSLSHVPQNKLFTHTGVKHEVDWESRGERALFQNAEQREMNDRMLAIEQELATLKNREESELETPRLGDDQLKDLIDQCVTSLSYTSMSRMTLNTESRTSFADTESVVSHQVESTVDNTPRSPRSARQEILDNPPKLAPEVLQKLLSEAYHPLSKQLTTLNEEENEEEETTPIPSEVWKLISMETVDENKSIDTVQSSYDSQMLTSISESFSDSNNVSGMMGKNQVNSRNGFRTLSRNSSASSLASVSEIGTGRETREKEPLKLPDIDPSGSLVTQGINNQRRTGSSNSVVRTPSNFVNNGSSDSKSDNFGPCDSRMELLSLDGDIMSPHPPNRDKQSKREGSGNKSRNGSRTHVS